MGKSLSLLAFDEVVSAIYEAAINPKHWDVALTSIASHFAPPHLDVGMLLWERVSPPAGRFIGATGVNDFARQGYLSFFAGQTPWSIAGHDMPIGSVAHSDRVVPRDVFKQSQFYRDFLQNWEMEVAILASLDRIGTDHLGLCFAGPEMHDVSEFEANIRKLVPHLQRATRISRRIGEADLRAANAEFVLDQSPSTIFCLNADLELLHANNAAQKILQDGDVFRLVANKLRASTSEMQAKLAELAKTAIAPPGLIGLHTASLFFERETGPQYRAIAMLADTGARGQFSQSVAGMKIMIVGGPQHEVPLEAMEHLRSWFDLTPAEARLAAWLTTGASIEDYVKMRGVSINAGRFLLKGIFSKTGVNRQSELVALLYEVPLSWARPIESKTLLE